MRDAIQFFFENDVATMASALCDLECCIPRDAEPCFDARYAKLNTVLTTTAAGCARLEACIADDERLLHQTRDRFYRSLSQWFDQSWIGERARSKPRGYPGDYRLLTVLYDNKPVGTGFPGYLDLYLLNLQLTCSIRSRWQKIREFIKDELNQRQGNVRILNVASGACREYSEPLEANMNRSIHLQCLDNDQEALDFVRDHVVARSGITDFRLDRFNALRLLSSKGAMRRFGQFDIVYSIGLFDYIPDAPLVAILRSCRELLLPSGVAYINFKDCARYDKTPYQWFLDWHFYQRSVGDCERLFREAGYDMESIDRTRDDTGVIVNFISREPLKSIRLDLGSEALPHPSVGQPWHDSKEA